MNKRQLTPAPRAEYDGIRAVWGDDFPFYVKVKSVGVSALAETVPVKAASPACGGGDEKVSASTAEKRSRLIPLLQEVRACRACALHRTRQKAVFGSGNVDARVAFVGEAPGRDEDEQGLPFVGKSGELLTKIIEDGMGMERQEVFILNVLRCRPPRNREPERAEVESCRGFLEKTLEIIKPELIVALGLSAAQALLQTTKSLGSLRGEVHDYRGMPLVTTYHPSALLRYPANKRQAWQDIKLALKLLGLPLSEKK